jgi:hypothetical protein
MEAAFRVPAREGQLGCPHCRERVIFRNGEVYVPHFAHKAVGPCPYSSDSLEILEARAALYRFLKSQPGLIVSIEHSLSPEKLKRPIDCWVKCGDKTGVRELWRIHYRLDELQRKQRTLQVQRLLSAGAKTRHGEVCERRADFSTPQESVGKACEAGVSEDSVCLSNAESNIQQRN